LKSIILISLFVFTSGCTAANSKSEGAASRKTASAGTRTQDVLAGDIGAIGVFREGGFTQCQEATHQDTDTDNKAYDCVTTVPIAFSVVQDKVQSKYDKVLTQYVRTEVLSVNNLAFPKDQAAKTELNKIHAENIEAMKKRFDDLRTGCMGDTVRIRTDEDAAGVTTVSMKGKAGDFPCTARKTGLTLKDKAVFYFNEAKAKAADAATVAGQKLTAAAQDLKVSASKSYESSAESINYWQEQARTITADKLKEIEQNVRPRK
jgi:hypothetical protein